MTTVHKGHEKVLTLRKCPALGSAGHKAALKVFGKEKEKELWIPKFIDDYNRFMHGVDIADQFRSYFTVQRQCKRNWKALLHFLVDISIVNAFRLSAYCDPSFAKLFKLCDKHLRFQTELSVALMKRCTETRVSRDCRVLPRIVLANHVSGMAPEHHRKVVTSKPRECKACQAAGRQGGERKVLGDITNEVRNLQSSQSKPRIKRTRYACSVCKIALCDTFLCWEQHLLAVRQRACSA